MSPHPFFSSLLSSSLGRSANGDTKSIYVEGLKKSQGHLVNKGKESSSWFITKFT